MPMASGGLPSSLFSGTPPDERENRGRQNRDGGRAQRCDRFRTQAAMRRCRPLHGFEYSLGVQGHSHPGDDRKFENGNPVRCVEGHNFNAASLGVSLPWAPRE